MSNNKLVANGIYSLKKDAWIKEPVQKNIPEINYKEIELELNKWLDRYNEIISDSNNDSIIVLDESKSDFEALAQARSIVADQIRGEWEAIKNYQKAINDLPQENYKKIVDILSDISNEEEVHVGELQKAQSLLDPDILKNIYEGEKEVLANNEQENVLEENVHTPKIDKIDAFINDLYAMRQQSLDKDGEFGIGNLVFKELRNLGYLEDLKNLRAQLIGKELSVESLEQTVEQDLQDNRSPIVQQDKEELSSPYSYKKEMTDAKGLVEDTVKQNGKWVNKGKHGTHGEFKTKKEADAQRKAMFANNFTESFTEIALQKELENEVNKILLKNSVFGFESEKEINELVMPKIEVTKQDDVIKLEVRAELDFEALTDLATSLQSFVDKFDPFAYFDIEALGILTSYIREFNESLNESAFSLTELNTKKKELEQLTHTQVLLQQNGLFNIYNVNEKDILEVFHNLLNLNSIEWVHKQLVKSDFTKSALFGQPQSIYYNITGKIKD